MELVYANKTLQMQCTSVKAAQKLFGGDVSLARSLLARINVLANAEVIKDIVMMPNLHFHKLEGKWKGYFAIDVKNRREPWRIIIQPLNDYIEPFEPCNIDEIARIVKIVSIREVSKHYE